MNQPLNVLLVDDHPFALNIYKRAVEKISSEIKTLINIHTANDCDSANQIIDEAKKGLSLDLVLLDISIPASKDLNYLSGEDIGIKLRQTFRDTKLIVLTSHNDNHKLCNIFKTLNPDGFLIKSDFDYGVLVKAVTEVIFGTPYYSKTVNKLIRLHMSNQIVLDRTDRKILYHLSIGAKMKDLPEIINLSLPGIERRKRLLRDVFDTKNKDDRALIQKAREKGFV